jgi:outer membrane putative beta-barrel porin/alpha-amylase
MPPRSEVRVLARPWCISLGVGLALLASVGARAQDLVPAAYVPTPIAANVVTTAGTYNSGDLSFDPAVPIDEARARIRSVSLSYARAIPLFGRSANVILAVPYVDGDLSGIYLGQPVQALRSGQADIGARLAVNLLGAPAMTAAEYSRYRPRTILGASLAVQAPTGEYDSSKLVNIGSNRWALKPEVGFVQVVGRWAFDVYLGGSFFTTNHEFFGGQTKEQDPILQTQAHVRFLIRPTLWAAVDGNFWRGGRTTIDGVERDDLQRNSRIGLTFSWQVARHHGLRFAASRGAITRIGGEFDSYGLSYSYSWLSGRR